MTTATETTRAAVHAGAGAPSRATVAAVATARQAGRRRRHGVLAALTTAVVLALFLSLMVGHTFYSPSEVLGVLLGHDVPGASFTVSRLRLPRATMALAAGLAFGMGGVTFQTMLRNPLASPDIIGISSGASAAAMIGILVFGLSGPVLSAVAIVAGLAVALLVYLLSYRNGVAGTRLILIGIGFGAMFDSVISYLLGRAASWDLQEAMRWLTGSLNGSDWNQALLVLAALAVLGPVLLGQSRNLSLLELGDEAAASLGVRTGRTRLIAVTAAVGLVAFATAATGPIAFVAFLSGPIAARMVGRTRSLVIPAALTGALLVLISDLAAQYLLGTRFPVGVVTGVLGAPYLLALIVRTNRTGGAL
ncbi:MAG TPA: iron ABC transporter permease [Ruania sp.]|nr:iron ABC transporter permease [Ruania sp.]